jgi:lipopolysaccharide transport system ATP-binding protein
LLDSGQLKRDGNTSDIVADYMTLASDGNGEKVWTKLAEAPGGACVRLHAVRICSDGQVKPEVDIDKPIEIQVEFWNQVADSRLFTDILVTDNMGVIVLESANTTGASTTTDKWFCAPHPVGLYRASCVLPANFLNEGRYYISVIIGGCSPPTKEAYAPQVISFDVFDTGALRTPGFGGKWNGVVRVPLAWETRFIETSRVFAPPVHVLASH